jgi:hypothetical protein
MYLPSQTRPVLLEAQPAPFVHQNRTDFFRRSAIHMRQNTKLCVHDAPAHCGQPQLWPHLQAMSGFHRPIGLCEGRPSELDATKRHPIGHLQLQRPLIGNSGAPLEHLASVTASSPWVRSKVGRKASEQTFSHMLGPRGPRPRPGSAPRSPPPTPWPTTTTAAPGGAGAGLEGQLRY